MQDVVRKRIVGAAVLIAIGILLPLTLVRFVQDSAPDDQAMRVYEITPSGGIEPVDGATQGAGTVTDSTRTVPDMPAATAVTAAGDNTQAADRTAAAEPAPATTATASAAQTAPHTVKSASDDRDTDGPRPADDAGLKQSVAAGSWVVQVASFLEESNARTLAQQLSGAFAVFYTPARIEGKTWYRVRIGPFDSEAAAHDTAAQLRAQRGDTLVLQVD